MVDHALHDLTAPVTFPPLLINTAHNFLSNAESLGVSCPFQPLHMLFPMPRKAFPIWLTPNEALRLSKCHKDDLAECLSCGPLHTVSVNTALIPLHCQPAACSGL